MDNQIRQLESILCDLTAAHERLLALLKDKRVALRRADRERVMDLCGDENQQVKIITDLEQRRLRLVADLTLAVDPAAVQPLKLKDLAQRLPEPARTRLLVLRTQLREKIELTQHEARATHQATERLLHHMQGLIQTVGGLMAGIATYAPRAVKPTDTMNVSTFSTTG